MAEELFFGKITTGASNDLQKVTQIVQSMVMRTGMSSLGVATYTASEETFVKPYSQNTEMVY